MPLPVLTSVATGPTIADRARSVSVMLARGRVGVGVAMLVGSGLSSRLAFGGNSREGRVALRLAGGRDIALGLGALTSVRERTQDAEWVGMAAAVDGIDAAVLLVTPGLPTRARLTGLGAAAAAVVGWFAARCLADDRADRDASG